MGCQSCKTVAVNPMTIVRNEEQLLENVEWTDQQSTIIQNTTPDLDEPEQTVIIRKPSSKANGFTPQPLNPKKLTSNDSSEVTIFHATDTRPTSTKTTKSNVYQEPVPERMSSKLNKQKSHEDIDISSTSVVRRKTTRPIVVESIISDTSDETISNRTSSESAGSNFHYDDVVSSSVSANTEKTMLRQQTIVRYTSAKVKNPKSNQNTFFNDMSGDSNESYPLHDSFVTSASSDLEELSTQQENVARSIFVDTQKSQVKQSIIADDTSNESDELDLHFQAIPSSKSSDSAKKPRHREAVIKFTSSNRKKSDIHQKPTVYESSSDSAHC